MLCLFRLIDIRNYKMNQKQKGETISFLLVGRIYEDQVIFKHIEEAIKIITSFAKSVLYFTDSRTLEKVVKLHPQVTTFQFLPNQHQQQIDYIVTIGGDGTILYAAKQFKGKVPPVITFQRGTVGFLCQFSLGEMQKVLQKLISFHKKRLQQPFQVHNLMRLQAIRRDYKNENKNGLIKVCINQVYISRKKHQRITLQIKVNDQLLTNTAGDGILISTPTGSTAYSLSAGGPIMQNGVNGILIVPISPNSLSFRPICFPSTATITVKLHSSSRSQAYVSFDGQTIQEFGFQHQIVIKRSSHDITFYQPKKGEEQMPTWIQRLKAFLGWNEKLKAPMQYLPQKLKNIKECEQVD